MIETIPTASPAAGPVRAEIVSRQAHFRQFPLGFSSTSLNFEL
jgi:hypothetical protein